MPRVRIPRTASSAQAHAVRLGRPRFVTPRRSWRRRGRRAQVAPVATILGLLLVVTFIANYLTTTLPNQMSVNDLNHDLQVENQVGQFQALVNAVAASGQNGASVSQPISLGSAGSPPFAQADAGTIAPGNLSGGFGVNFTVAGPSVYSPPTGAPLGGSYTQPSGSICPKPSSTGFSDTGTCYDTWNFTGPAGTSFSFGMTGAGSEAIIVTTNSSTITVTGTGGSGNHFEFIGSHNTISMTGVGNGATNISVIGSYNALSISTTGTGTVVVYVYGNHDSVSITSTGGATGPVKVVVYGTLDTFSVPGDTGGQIFNLYLNGFNATAPTSSLCPYANLSSTDTVTGFTETGSGGLTQYDNNAVGYYANGTGAGSCTGNATCWTTHSRNVPLTTCPFFSSLTLPIPSGASKPGAAFTVQLANTYAPVAQVAYDQGAVIYAQPGGTPLMIDPPQFSYVSSALTLTIPIFQGTIPTESGRGTTDVMLRLLTETSYQLPATGFSLVTGSHVTLVLKTPYGAAWMTFFGSISALTGHVGCAGLTGACSGAYQPNGPLATITLSIPAKSLDLTVAVFAVSLT